MAARAEGSEAVDAYLAEAPEAHRAALQVLREQVRALAPEATESISYGIPGFKYRGKGLVWYASFKAHCSMFPGARAHRYADRLEGYKLQKGTIQFKPERPIPPDVIKDLILERVAEIDAGGR